MNSDNDNITQITQAIEKLQNVHLQIANTLNQLKELYETINFVKSSLNDFALENLEAQDLETVLSEMTTYQQQNSIEEDWIIYFNFAQTYEVYKEILANLAKLQHQRTIVTYEQHLQNSISEFESWEDIFGYVPTKIKQKWELELNYLKERKTASLPELEKLHHTVSVNLEELDDIPF